MAIKIKHKKVSEKPDSSDTSLVLPSDWNDTHEMKLGASRLLGNPTNAAGDAAEIPLGAGLSFAGGALVADVTQSEFDTGLAGKVAKTGDTMTGALTVDLTNASIEIHGDNRQWYLQALENGSSPYFRLVDRNAGAEAFRVGTDGSLWCRQFGDLNTHIEQRALEWANDRVAKMAMRKVSAYNVNRPNNVNQWYLPASGAVLHGLNIGGNGEIHNLQFIYLQLYDPIRGWVTMLG